jgi:hypothetical protein
MVVIMGAIVIMALFPHTIVGISEAKAQDSGEEEVEEEKDNNNGRSDEEHGCGSGGRSDNDKSTFDL